MNRIQPIAAYVPYMTAPGNHGTFDSNHFEYLTNFLRNLFLLSQRLHTPSATTGTDFICLVTEIATTITCGTVGTPGPSTLSLTPARSTSLTDLLQNSLPG